MNHPFTIVDKSERRSPLQQIRPRHCDHDTVYTSDKYPASGRRYICTDCGRGTTHPRDLK